MRLWPQRAGRGACFRPRLTGRGICSAPWPAGRRTSGQARAGVNGTGRKLRGEHGSRIARSKCTCSHTFVCNVRGRVTFCLPSAAVSLPGGGSRPTADVGAPPSRPGRRRVTMAYMSFFDDMPTAQPEPRVHRWPGSPELVARGRTCPPGWASPSRPSARRSRSWPAGGMWRGTPILATAGGSPSR